MRPPLQIAIACGLALVGACAGLRPDPLAAQVSRPVLTLDLDSLSVAGRIPFDEAFELRGKAPADLVQLTLLMRPSDQFPAELCRPVRTGAQAPASPASQSAPGDSATWTRNDTRAVFSLVFGAIEADQQYTFCVRTLTSQPDSVNARIRRTAALKMVEAARTYFSENAERPSSEAVLHSLREALLAALPSTDDAWYLDDGRYVPYDAQRMRSRIDSHQAVDYDALYSRLLQTWLNVNDNGIANFKLHADGLKVALHELGAVLRSVHLDRGLGDVGNEDRPRFLIASAIATSLPNFNERERYLIAYGATPLRTPDANAAEPPLESARTGADLAATRARLDTLGAQLRDLLDLASFAAHIVAQAGPGAHPQATQEARDLGQAIEKVNASRDDLFQLRADVDRVVASLDAMFAAALELVPAVTTFKLSQIAYMGSSTTTYVDHAKDYISADLGILTATGFPSISRFAGGAVQAYFGANFYFAPVNRQASYGFLCSGYNKLKCFSLTLALTTGSIARTNVRTDLFGSHSLYTAIGARLSSYVRGSVGAVFFQSYSNDSRRSARVTATFAFGLSLDWDVKSALGGFGDLLSGK